jgi:hypothetical protein
VAEVGAVVDGGVEEDGKRGLKGKSSFLAFFIVRGQSPAVTSTDDDAKEESDEMDLFKGEVMMVCVCVCVVCFFLFVVGGLEGEARHDFVSFFFFLFLFLVLKY